MSRFRLGKALRRLRRDERGIALPVAMLTTAIGMTFAAVVVVASVSTQKGDSRDQASNSALAAADAAANLAVLRQNKVEPRPSNSLPCVVESSGKLALATKLPSGWCNEVVLTSSPAGTTAKYQVRPAFSVDASGNASGTIEVVATGSTTGTPAVVRRVRVTAAANVSSESLVKITKLEEEEKLDKEETIREEEEQKKEEKEGTSVNPFSRGQVVGIDSLKMNNNAQVYAGGVGSNGSVEMVGSANTCGTVAYGTTFSTDNSSSNKAPSYCSTGRTSAKGTSEYPAVVLPSDIASNNSNARLAAADPVGPNVWQRGNIGWNASNRTLSINYDQITLEGTAPYFLCQLVLGGGSKLFSGSGKKIRVFFDSPSNCPGLNGAAQLQIANGAYIGADAANGPGFYFVGSSTAGASKIELGGGAEVSQFVVYAPKSTIVANNGVKMRGAIVGKTLELGGGAVINQGGAFTPPPPGDYTTTPPSGPDPAKVKVREERKHEREVRKTVREQEIKELRTQTGSFKRGAYVECTAKGQLDSGC